jgi:hypothetical protein
MKPVIRINDKFLSLSCFSIFVLILLFGLWPYNLNPVNGVFWLREGPGLRFLGNGRLYTAGDLAPFFSGRNISLEMTLRPAAEPSDRLPIIVGLWDGRRQEVFLVGQWKDYPAVRVRRARPDIPRGYRERGKRGVLVRDRSVALTLTSSAEGTRLYVNGEMSAEWPGFPLLAEGPAGPAALLIGNSAVGHSPWEGELGGLGFFNRVLTDREVAERQAAWARRDIPALRNSPGLVGLYPLTEGRGERIPSVIAGGPDLLKPSAFRPLQQVVLEWPHRVQWKRWTFYQDLTVNILGFIPWGFFSILWLWRFTSLSAPRAAALTLLLGFLLSLGIELTQVYLPSRDSQVSDLVCNVLGTALGMALARWKYGMMEYWNNGKKTKKRL